ncbi:hypothetical protein [Halomonas urumqiensis]|uniref:Uncharacterized protein n=1 Tax=Halomonas urumqiensis TaxID=1684789 RepID=A0A2N7UCV1_9GAMM|nr:hypothetical protein [Halomonas urumqiensis]PMR78247.1 hypothetical protein C1H70_15880 [Halomonas urumqiensis]PTB03395.1 hypothetical protein C6V82_02515 [Halomonas urumqiensis]GHE20435.1 hypothetical protein GCM10017767_09560 [Halomonas urumqiensis]
MEDFFTWIGTTLGEIIRFIVDLLTGFFGNIGNSARGFLDGLSSSLGISPSFLNLIVLIIGLWMLWKAVSALMRRAIFATLIWAVLGLMVLSWLIN